jgi:hypothetical protein
MRRFLARYSFSRNGKRKTTTYSLVLAENPVAAAEYYLRHVMECGVRKPDTIWLYEVVGDDTPGVKVAANTDGDIRYDVVGDHVTYSEKNWA